MVEILKKEKTKLRVRAYEAPLKGDKILGEGIDILSMPDGHLSCAQCQSPWMECQVCLDSHRLEVGCCKCGWNTRVLFPIDVDLFKLGNGIFSCKKHPGNEMVVIKNDDTVCIGCRYCKTEARILLQTKSNLVLA